MLGLIKKNPFVTLLILLFLFFRIPSLFEPYWYGDEGIYLTLGEGIRKGLTLYSQIHDNKPPTLYYFAAISQTVFGFRLLLMLVMIPAIFYFYKLSLKFLKPKLASIATLVFLIFTSIPFFEGNIANAEVFMLLPTILGFLYFLNAKKPHHYLISAILLGFAFTIKIPVLFEFLFLFAFLLIDRLELISDFKISSIFNKIKTNSKTIVYFFLGFFIPIFVWGIYFYLKGAFQPFLVASLLQNFGYISSWSTGTQTASVASGGIVIRFIFLLVSWIIIYFLGFKKIINRQISFILFWFAATIFSVLLSTRPYPHYLVQLLPPLTLILVIIFSRISLKERSLLFISLLVLIGLLFKYQFYFYPILSYYRNFYSYALHFKNQAQYRSYFGDQVNSTYEISDYINQNKTPSKKIFIWGDNPYIYPLTHTLPVGRYTVAYHIVDFNAYEETIGKIKANLPEFIIYYPMNNRPFPKLDNLISRYYYPIKTSGSAIIFKLR